MAVDRRVIAEALRHFYDFTGEATLLVGAGSSIALGPARKARSATIVDKDPQAIAALRAEAVRLDGGAPVELLCARFEETRWRGDVVYFEFCLHQMGDPDEALRRARSIAPSVVVLDHAPGSEWMRSAAEDDKVLRSAAALDRAGVARRERFDAEQRFGSRDELAARLAAQGPVAAERIRALPCGPIALSMPCELVLLRRRSNP